MTGRRIAAIALGELAWLAFQAPRAAAHVLARVTGALYLRTGPGTLLWVSPPGSVLHARAVLAPLPVRPLSRGEGPLVIGEGKLLLGADCVAADGAPIWSPPGPAPPARSDDERVRGAIEAVWTKGLPGRAHPVLGLVPADALAEAHRRLGLGPGLTPSGDDYALGLLFGLRAAAPGASFAPLQGEIRALLASARDRTNIISATLLADAAEGNGPEPLHRLAAGLLAGRPAGELLAAAGDLLSIGHSTGGAILEGFLTGLWAALAGTAPALIP